MGRLARSGSDQQGSTEIGSKIPLQPSRHSRELVCSVASGCLCAPRGVNLKQGGFPPQEHNVTWVPVTAISRSLGWSNQVAQPVHRGSTARVGQEREECKNCHGCPSRRCPSRGIHKPQHHSFWKWETPQVHHDVEHPRKPSANNPRRPDDDLYSTPRMYGSNRCP